MILLGADRGLSRGSALKICRDSAAVAEAGLIRVAELERPFAEVNTCLCFDEDVVVVDNLAVSDKAWYIALRMLLSIIQCTRNSNHSRTT